MKSLKMKLTSALIMVALAIAMLIVGVWAAQTQTLTMTGSVNFEIADKSLYVKDVKIKNDNVSDAESIDSFLPGYINGEFNMNLTTIPENTLGTFQLHFYIINTSQTAYTVTYTLSDELQNQNISVTLQNSEIPSTTLSNGENITQDTPESVILILQVSAPNMDTLDLSGITLHIDEKELQVYDDYMFQVVNENEINILWIDSIKTDIIIPSKVSIEKREFSETYFVNQTALFIYALMHDPVPETIVEQKLLAISGLIDCQTADGQLMEEVTIAEIFALSPAAYPVKVIPLYKCSTDTIEDLRIYSNSINYMYQNGYYEGEVLITGGDYNNQSISVEDFYSYVNSLSTISEMYTIEFTGTFMQDVLVEGDDYTVTSLGGFGSIFMHLGMANSITIPSTITHIENNIFDPSDDIVFATQFTIESGYVFQNAGMDGEECGGLLAHATTVKVLASLIDDEGLTNEYLDSSGSFTRAKEGDYYVYTKN